jgi:hypothetical protein
VILLGAWSVLQFVEATRQRVNLCLSRWRSGSTLKPLPERVVKRQATVLVAEIPVSLESLYRQVTFGCEYDTHYPILHRKKNMFVLERLWAKERLVASHGSVLVTVFGKSCVPRCLRYLGGVRRQRQHGRGETAYKCVEEEMNQLVGHFGLSIQ